MISIVRRGIYSLIETKRQTKILILDNKNIYAWINAINIGEILVASHKMHRTDCILATGSYRIYKVKDEPKLSDQLHLELYIGLNNWQGYLLPNGLPTNKNTKHRIIPTTEIITKANATACFPACECPL